MLYDRMLFINAIHTHTHTIFFWSFCLLRATPAAYGGFQARGPIRTIAAAYARATAMWDPSHVCDLCHSSQQCWILKPLSEARD